MNQTDLIILTVYLISITYVIYQAINSLEAQTIIKFEKGALTQVLSEETIADQPLSQFLDINFSFKGRYGFSSQPATITGVIANKSATATIAIDWDSSSITNFAGKVRRVIHLIPDLTPDSLSEPQIKSTIPPGRSLQATLAPEDLVKPNDDRTTLVAKGAIVDLGQVEKADAGRFALFNEREANLQFTLRLLFQIINIADGAKREYWAYVPCLFTIEKASLMEYFPWLPD
ncbi:hypothetical protein [Leptolyngbya ohadii]|uniref:hypothetical protein n=1 Tax=Leptolyngbya ohadii TaxID=1962290 RepID=UPI000B59B765|nr:hypothetical protein [Leptolyngbya ohadii]